MVFIRTDYAKKDRVICLSYSFRVYNRSRPSTQTVRGPDRSCRVLTTDVNAKSEKIPRQSPWASRAAAALRVYNPNNLDDNGNLFPKMEKYKSDIF